MHTLVSGHALQEDWPFESWKVPSVHSVAAMAPGLLKEPGGHSTQASLFAACVAGPNVPDGHSIGCGEPGGQ